MKAIYMAFAIAAVMLFSSADLYAASYQMHTVQNDETYYIVSKTYGVNVSRLESINYQPSGNLQPGNLIKIRLIKDISVKVNGHSVNFDAKPYIENGSVFVPVRSVSEALNTNSIEWNQKTKTATIKAGVKNIVISAGSDSAYVDGQAVRLNAPVQFYDSRIFVPVRFFAQTLGVDNIKWDQDTYTVSIEKNGLAERVSRSYSEEDLYWLSRLVEAEAGGEPFEGKLAVAATVINRKNSPDFPDTIKGVIFDTNFGTQYTPVENGTIYNTPSEESIEAARQALEGNNVIGGSMYFVNPSIATSTWIENNRTYYMTIDNHKFYL